MALQENGQAAAIAAEWGVEVALLEDSEWEIDTIDGNDGEVYGYLIRFADDTDPKTLEKLGFDAGDFTRQVSLNVFDQPEPEETNKPGSVGPGNGDTYVGASFAGHSSVGGNDGQTPQASGNDEDDGIYSVMEPFPDISNFIDEDLELVESTERVIGGRRAYYIGDKRFTPSQFRRLSRHRKIEAIVQWFGENYEDPAVRTPYESAEGGFQWVWGGPYDAHDQIGDQFSDLTDEATIEQAVSEVTRDGVFDWAPKARREDYLEDEDWNQPQLQEDYSRTTLTRRDPTPSGEPVVAEIARSNFFPDSNFSNFAFVPDGSRTTTTTLATDKNVSIGDDKGNRLIMGEGTDSVEMLRREMLARMDRLEAVFRQNLDVSPKRGHNRPPELLEIERPVTQAQLLEVVAAIEEVKRQSESKTPDVLKVEAQVSVFKRLALFFANGVLWAAGASVAGVIGQEAGAAFTSHKQQIAEALIGAVHAVSAWLQHLPSIF